MSQIGFMVEVAVTLLILIAAAAYWASRDDKADKEGKY